MPDNRRYFRVEDVMIVRLTPLNASEAAGCRLSIQARAPLPVYPGPPLVSQDVQIEKAIDHLRVKSPKVSRVLDLMHQKIQVLTQALSEAQSGEKPWGGLLPEWVNVSAKGMGLSRSDDWAVGQVLLLELVLFPEQLGIQLLAEVIERRAEGPWNLGLAFTVLSPEDEELLIRHVLQKEASQIKQERIKIETETALEIRK